MIILINILIKKVRSKETLCLCVSVVRKKKREKTERRRDQISSPQTPTKLNSSAISFVGCIVIDFTHSLFVRVHISDAKVVFLQ